MVQNALSLPDEQKKEALLILHKMLALNFTASFEKVIEGPVLRVYYFRPHNSSMLGKIFSKEEDIALAIGSESVLIRREAGLIAVSVPKKERQIISFQSCLHEFMLHPKAREAELPFMIGKSSSGELLWADIATQPHLLIGGSTNSGKSIFLSELICSLVMMKAAKNLKITVVDTKQLDLTLFSELSHVREVITDVTEFRENLEGSLSLIRDRLSLMSGQARNIKEWNEKGPIMPYELLIIDELADVLDQDNLLLSALPPKQRPASIQLLLKQIAQISRAAGFHIIAATQRPSVDVIKGDTKTNFPSRIAFRLPTMQDSRVVLDENGAENLLGMGDMLCKLAGSDSSTRAHSAFVTMKDILEITSQNALLREQYKQMSEQLLGKGE